MIFPKVTESQWEASLINHHHEALHSPALIKRTLTRLNDCIFVKRRITPDLKKMRWKIMLYKVI